MIAAGEEGFAFAPLSKIIALGSLVSTFGNWIAEARAAATVSPFLKLLAFDTFLQLGCFFLMMYNSRVFERRVGSRKFGSFLAGGVVFGLMMATGWAWLWVVESHSHRLPFLPFLCLPPTLCNVCPYPRSKQMPSVGQHQLNGNLVLLCTGMLVRLSIPSSLHRDLRL